MTLPSHPFYLITRIILGEENKLWSCKFWDFHGSDASSWGLLGCEAEWLIENLCFLYGIYVFVQQINITNIDQELMCSLQFQTSY
jgi:hypothetical protein